MGDISELERRISFALERIEKGVERMRVAPPPALEAPEAAEPAEAVPAADPAELAELTEALATERAANAQLSERVRAIREKQETTLSALEKKLGAATRALDAAQAENARLKRANADLIAANETLVASGSEGAGALVNRVMQAELEALRAARSAEEAEVQDILASLEPVLAAAETRANEESSNA